MQLRRRPRLVTAAFERSHHLQARVRRSPGDARRSDFMFTPTHEITLVFEDGTCADVEVQLVRDAAYTREEWNEGRHPSWRIVDGTWTWCGRPRPPHCERMELRSAAQAAFRRLTWELVDGRVTLAGARLVLARDEQGHASLWLEIVDDVLLLAHEHGAYTLSSTTTALRLRGLVHEWKATGAITPPETR